MGDHDLCTGRLLLGVVVHLGELKAGAGVGEAGKVALEDLPLDCEPLAEAVEKL
jgi:hypothetical protein